MHTKDQAMRATPVPVTDSGWLWETFVEESPTPVFVVNRQGVVEYANAQAQSLLTPDSGGGVVGKGLTELLGEEHARERLEHITDVLSTGKTIMFDEMRRGKQLRCMMRPIPMAGGARAVLMIVHLSATGLPHPNGFALVRAKNNDAGRLSGLTARELEILKLIGLGLSTADIARHLGRSVKTVEWHRVSLGEKLGIVNRVELARIAIAAGLVGVEERPPVQVQGD